MLAACTEEKIVLLGGSSVLYGFNTNEMQRGLSKPTFNACVNVGLGFRYMLDKLEPHLKPGNHVILPLEFSQYTNPPYMYSVLGLIYFCCAYIGKIKRNISGNGNCYLFPSNMRDCPRRQKKLLDEMQRGLLIRAVIVI